MKEFKKNKNGLFICEECGKECNKIIGLAAHIASKHNRKDYFDKWILEKTDNSCKYCDNETIYNGRWSRGGYNTYCSKKCKNLDGISNETKEKIKISLKNTCQKRYNKDSYTQTEEFKEKSKKTLFIKYGITNPMQSGVFKLKKETTNLKIYGFNTPPKSPEVKLKTKLNYFKKYGIYHHMHNPEIFRKVEKNSFVSKLHFSGVNFRGSYEEDFLNKYHNVLNIKSGFGIKYTMNEKEKVYYPDFYIKSLNLIVEIKNSWLAKRDETIINMKKESCIKNNYSFILIIDKNYKEFEKLIEFS